MVIFRNANNSRPVHGICLHGARIYREIPSQTAHSLINNTILICFSPERVQFAGLINLPHSSQSVWFPNRGTARHTNSQVLRIPFPLAMALFCCRNLITMSRTYFFPGSSRATTEIDDLSLLYPPSTLEAPLTSPRKRFSLIMMMFIFLTATPIVTHTYMQTFTHPHKRGGVW